MFSRKGRAGQTPSFSFATFCRKSRFSKRWKKRLDDPVLRGVIALIWFGCVLKAKRAA
jgi:hypothetical protein